MLPNEKQHLKDVKVYKSILITLLTSHLFELIRKIKHMQYFTFQYLCRQNISNSFLAEEVSFLQSVTFPFLPKTAFESFVQFHLFCTFCKLAVAKTETKLSATEEKDMRNSGITCCLASLFQPSMYSSCLAKPPANKDKKSWDTQILTC